MKCRHYKKEGYTYFFNGTRLDLCEQCEMELLAQMKEQEVYENKLQKITNVSFQKQIDKLRKNETKL